MMTPDLQQAQKFLKQLDKNTDKFTFQTFDDNKEKGHKKDKGLCRVLNGTLKDHFGTLVTLNKNGAGIFVTVNETDLTGRKTENIIGIRAVFQEADRPGTPEPPLTPQIEVESSPGKRHRYWLVDQSQRIEGPEWTKVMRRMVAEHGSDPNAMDLARVLRLPGFYHMKNPATPHMVNIISTSGEPPHSWDKITAAIPPMDEPTREATATAPGRGLTKPLTLAHALKEVSPDSEYKLWLEVLMALHHASGGSADGLAMADEWSEGGMDYKDGEVAYKWSSFGNYAGNPVTEASIYSRAKVNGWTEAKANLDNFDQALTITHEAILAAANDPTAHLNPAAVEAFSIVRAVDEMEYERLRTGLKTANSKVRMGALDRFTKGTGESDDKQSFASALTDLAAARCTLFHDADGAGYASFNRAGELGEHCEHWKLESTGFKEWLGYLAHSEMEEAPSSEALRSVTNALNGIAKFDGEELEVFTRVAQTEAGHWIDLGDESWRAILVTATGWQVVQRPPVKFIRSKNTRPLPWPEQGGDIAELWSLTNIPESDRLFVLAWILEALRSGTPYPVLEFIGEQGSAKSTTQALLRRFIDNSKVLLRGRPKTVEDIFVAAAMNHVVSYENLSGLTPEMSDALCSVSTGAGYAARQFYTNSEEASMTAHNPIMLNGIGAVVTRPDLLDRTVAVILPTITERKSEAELDARVAEAQGRIMGAILDIYSGALLKLPEARIEPSKLPRLADFALLGEAMSRHLGHAPGVWLDAYVEHRRDAIQRTIDASPVAVAVIDLVGRGGRHNGTVGELLTKLNAAAFDLERGDYWPRSAKGLGDSLRRVAPALRQMGIHVSIEPKPRRDGVHCQVHKMDGGGELQREDEKGRVFDFHASTPNRNPSSPSSPSSPPGQRARL